MTNSKVTVEQTATAEGLYRALTRLSAVLRRGDPTTSVADDLTLAQLSILVTLLNEGPMRMTDLAARERVRTPTTTVAVRRLEKMGLVERSRDTTDLRAVLVGITARGQSVHEKSLATRHAALAAMLNQLTPSELQILKTALAPLERLTASTPVTMSSENAGNA